MIGLPLARITVAPRAILGVLGYAAFALAIGALERKYAGSHGADLVLPEIFGAVVVPLLVFGVVGATVLQGSLRASIRPLTAIGASGTNAALASVLVAAIFGAVVCGGLGAALVPISGSPVPFRADMIASAWVSALGAAAYASFFALGATFGRKGGGRAALLLVDWFLGSSPGIDVVTPRAHLRNLLGGAPLAHVSQTASAVTLGAFALVCLAISVRRAR